MRHSIISANVFRLTCVLLPLSAFLLTACSSKAGPGTVREPHHPWHYGLPAREGPFGIREIHTPPGPSRTWGNKTLNRNWYAPEAFLPNGDLVLAFDNFGVRYDPARHRLLPGSASWCNDCGIAAPGRPQEVWWSGGNSGCISYGVTRFTRRLKTAFPRWLHRVWPGQLDSIAVELNGNAWISGWHVSDKQDCGWLEGLGVHAPGLSRITPRGWAALWLVNPQTGVERTIHAPAPGPLTAVAVHNQFVWMIDPYHRCLRRDGVRRCKAPRLLRYDRSTGRFATFIVPRRFSLRPLGSTYYYNDAMTVTRNTVWTLILNGPPRRRPHPGRRPRRRFVLLGFRHGVFFEVHLWPWWSITSTNPLMSDEQGRIWLQTLDGSPIFFDPHTNKLTKLNLRHGVLLQDFHHRIWYVRGAQT